MGQALSFSLEEVPDELVYRVLQFLSWSEREQLQLVNKRCRDLLATEESWQWRCKMLHSQDGVYISPINHAATWKETFQQHWALRQRWLPSDDPTATPQVNFRIRVCARFRPLPKKVSRDGDGIADESAVEAAQDRDKRVVVPLHQRLRLIKAQFKCDDKEARRRLWGGEHDNDPWKDAAVQPVAKNEGLLGKLSSRPPLADANVPSANTNHGCDDEVEHLPNTITTGILAVRPETQDMLLCAPGAGLKRFRFDSVFNDKSAQPTVYDQLAAPVVSEFLNGVSGTVFAYGQTGSGKTFTMYGPDSLSGSQVKEVTTASGIVPRALHEAIAAVQQRRRHGIEGTLRMTVVEVYGNEVNNLLDDGATVGAWHGVAVRAVLQDTLGVEVTDPSEAEEMLRRAEANKRQAATAMNERSSRAHTLTFLSLVQHRGDVALRSLLCLADLGGSEQIKKSKASGQRLQEAVQINLGLLALKEVITALKRKRDHVPFLSSTLTYLLQPTMEGAAFATVVVTGSLEQQHTSETLNAMRFGQVCSNIDGAEGGSLAMDVAGGALDALNEELEQLEERIQSEERWVTRTEQRQDLEGTETVVKTELEGAEELRERYEQLLQTRRELVGF
eukprot:m.99974 g.99974  ORF g.99974 m.99974 type:complete len:617 (+) comp15110_c0_seq2:94-1944(+)